MGISRQSYYKYRNALDKDYKDYLVIKECFEKGNKLYGYRRLKVLIMKETGWIINHKKLLRIMRKYGLKVKYQKVFEKNYNKLKV